MRPPLSAVAVLAAATLVVTACGGSKGKNDDTAEIKKAIRRKTSTTAPPSSTTSTVHSRPGIPGYSGAGSTVAANFKWGNDARRYLVYAPTALTSDPAAPVVVVMPGTGGNSKAIEIATGFDARAERDKFIVAYLDPARGNWNTAGDAAKPDDFGYIGEVLNRLGR